MTPETMEMVEYLPEEKQREIAVDLRTVTDTAKTLTVQDDESMAKANNQLSWIVVRQKNLEALRLAIVKPIKDHLKKIDGYFNGLSAKFDEPKDAITKKVVDYREHLAKQARKKHQDEPVKTTNHDLGQVTYVKCSEWEISKPELVPDEFYAIDKIKLGSRVRELQRDLSVGKVYKDLIPGVTIKITERPSVKGE